MLINWLPFFEWIEILNQCLFLLNIFYIFLSFLNCIIIREKCIISPVLHSQWVFKEYQYTGIRFIFPTYICYLHNKFTYITNSDTTMSYIYVTFHLFLSSVGLPNFILTSWELARPHWGKGQVRGLSLLFWNSSSFLQNF